MKGFKRVFAEKPNYGQQIVDYVTKSTGLKAKGGALEDLHIHQTADGKTLSLKVSEIEDILVRFDSDNRTFLQVNFRTGRKILITDSLIGFKPVRCSELDMEKLPRVVTTPDLLSVVEAIEETMSSEGNSKEELEVLKKVYESVVKGAESVGFELTSEKLWLQRLSQLHMKASA